MEDVDSVKELEDEDSIKEVENVDSIKEVEELLQESTKVGWIKNC